MIFENQFGIDIGTDYSEVLGTSLEYSIEYYLKKYGLKKYDIDILKKQKEQAYYLMAKQQLVSLPNCVEFIELLRSRSINYVVASSGSLEKITFSLNLTGLTKYFKTLFSTEQVKNGKPAPDLFLYAAKHIGIVPEKCVVIEDSINGLQAAQSAGMKVIGLVGSFTETQLAEYNPEMIISNYSELISMFRAVI